MIWIKAKNPSLAWLKATHRIIEQGERVGELPKEVLYLGVEIRNPLKVEEKIDREFRKFVGDKWIDQIAGDLFPQNQFDLEGFPTGGKRGHYSYWERLTKHWDFNQLEYIIKRLQKRPRSKLAFCVTFDPKKDAKPLLDEPKRPYLLMPCLTSLDFKCRGGQLNLFALFRSHDFGRKAYGNYVGLGKLLGFIARRTNLNIGKLVCVSCSAHIRAKEFETIKRLLSKLED